MKTDHLGVIIPAGIKLKPFRTKISFRDYRAQNKVKFQKKLAEKSWSEVTSMETVEEATKVLGNDMIDQCFPKKTVTLSTRDPPWMSPLLKYLIRKISKAKSRRKLSIAAELTERISGIISHNRTKMAKSECIGTSQW
jgi:hypothetical protein